MLKMKLQYFGHLRQRTDSLEKTLMLGKIENKRGKGADTCGQCPGNVLSDGCLTPHPLHPRDRGVFLPGAAAPSVTPAQLRLSTGAGWPQGPSASLFHL